MFVGGVTVFVGSSIVLLLSSPFPPESSLASTITVLVLVALFLAASSTVYVIVYFPFLEVSTLPVVTILLVKSPSLLSFAVAPASL